MKLTDSPSRPEKERFIVIIVKWRLKKKHKKKQTHQTKHYSDFLMVVSVPKVYEGSDMKEIIRARPLPASRPLQRQLN